MSKGVEQIETHEVLVQSCTDSTRQNTKRKKKPREDMTVPHRPMQKEIEKKCF